MLKQKFMWVAWPAFIAAAILEMLVFALIDPGDLHWRGELVNWSARAIYTGSFFVFWLLAMISSALTVMLADRD
jgi:hypothetical protein